MDKMCKLKWYHRIRDDDGYFMYAEPVTRKYESLDDLYNALADEILWELNHYSFLMRETVDKEKIMNCIKGNTVEFLGDNEFLKKYMIFSKDVIELEEYFKFEIIV